LGVPIDGGCSNHAAADADAGVVEVLREVHNLEIHWHRSRDGEQEHIASDHDHHRDLVCCDQTLDDGRH